MASPDINATATASPDKQGAPGISPKKYTYKDYLDIISRPSMYSSVGKMTLSSKPSAPAASFGTARRDARVFQSKEMSSSEFKGKFSPGPIYNTRGSDAYYYRNEPTWSLSQQERNTLETKLEVNSALSAVRHKPQGVRIGLETRFTNEALGLNNTPGPEYDPKERPEYHTPLKYSFGYRRQRKGESALIVQSSTPNLVGPGRYPNLNTDFVSTLHSSPAVTMKKASRFEDPRQYSKHETFDNKSSIGAQFNSQKKSSPMTKFSKAKRDQYTGIFQSSMVNHPTKISIAMPQF